MPQKTLSRLTIKDIARLSGVSKSTVSRVINHDSNVRSTTRDAVLAVINQFHFTPSKTAQALRGYKNKVIGIIVTRLDSGSENHLLRHMLPLFYQADFDAIIVESQFSATILKEHLALFKNRNVDGLIVFAFSQLDPVILQEWQPKMVVLARHYSRFASVYYDDSGAMTYLLQLVYERGHRHIAYIGVNLNDHTSGYLRHKSYLDFCRVKQLKTQSYLGKTDYESGYYFAKRALAKQPTAIVCATDTLAVGVNKYLQEQKSNSVLVASIGKGALLRFLFPDTISIEMGISFAGQMAATELLAILQHQKKPESHLIPYCPVLT